MASIDYMCDVGYAAPPKSVHPMRQATSVVCLFALTSDLFWNYRGKVILKK